MHRARRDDAQRRRAEMGHAAFGHGTAPFDTSTSWCSARCRWASTPRAGCCAARWIPHAACARRAPAPPRRRENSWECVAARLFARSSPDLRKVQVSAR
jgi:hypothetical protein